MSNKICVLGDIFRHVIIKPSPGEPGANGHDRKYPPYRAFVTFAGAPFIRQMIVDAIAEPKSDDEEAKINARNEAKNIVHPAYDFTQDKPDLSQRLLYILDYFPKSFDKPADMVLRVKPNYNYLTAEVRNYNLETRTTVKPVTDNKSLIEREINSVSKHPSLLVIYDRNHSFRTYTTESNLSQLIIDTEAK